MMFLTTLTGLLALQAGHTAGAAEAETAPLDMTTIDGAITVDFAPEGCKDARKSKFGDSVDMHYTGTIDESSKKGQKGKQFDSSVGRGSPFNFKIGQGQVIKAWDQGALGMCIGEKRTLIVPPELGYGDQGAGADIPGGATLKFTIECMGITDGPPEKNFFQEIDSDKDKQLSADEVQAWFQKEQKQDMPAELMDSEDKNKDGFISWTEFSGPKGSHDPADL
jgi:hypothetical protein